MYKSDKLIINFLKMAVKICDVSQFVYLAMHNYRTFRFKEALKVTILVKSKLTQSFIPYKNIEKKEFYNKSVSGLSLSKRIRKAWAKFVKLYSGNTYYLSELLFEQKLCEEKGIASSTKKILMEHYSPKQNYSGQRRTWEPGLPSEQSTILDTKSQL